METTGGAAMKRGLLFAGISLQVTGIFHACKPPLAFTLSEIVIGAWLCGLALVMWRNEKG